MSVNVKALLTAKSENKAKSQLVMKDVNRDLIVALLAIPVYGKEVRDEEILSVIINAGAADVSDIMLRIREEYDKKVKEKRVKKTKNGVVDTDGFMVLVPRT